VALTLNAGRLLDRNQVAGSSSWSCVRRRHEPRDVAVVDSSGSLLTTAENAGSTARLQYVSRSVGLCQAGDRHLERRWARDTAAPPSADVDFNQVESTSEEFKPNQNPDSPTVRSARQRRIGRPGHAQPSGVPARPATSPRQRTGAAAASAPACKRRSRAPGPTACARDADQLRVTAPSTARGAWHGAHQRGVVLNYRGLTDAKGQNQHQHALGPRSWRRSNTWCASGGLHKERGDKVEW